ncbi:hypothetical protein [Nocardia sp. CY41]|uniref:hypothetical protein n=1 Tax=Nocardia sp. CY41 TaxID=2608686 RepID=UPI0013593F67|nr:hypothetical protein [Nocardia sp. CY41]
MDEQLMVTDTPLGALLQLLALALQRSAGDEPTVLVEERPDADCRSLDWGPGAVYAAGENLSAMLSALLEAHPSVVWIPLWERAAESRRPHYDQHMQELRPYSRDSGLAVLLPAGELSSRAAVTMRQYMYAHWDVVAVIEAGRPTPLAHFRFRVAAVVLRAKTDPAPPLRMFRVPTDADADDVRSDFARLLEQGGGHSKFGYVLREIPDADIGLNFDAHDPAVKQQRASLSGFGGVVRLRELYEFPPRIHYLELKEKESAPDTAGAARVLRGQDVGRDGVLAAPSEDTWWSCIAEQFHLAVGDVLVRRMYRRNDSGGLVLVTVRPEDLPAVASDHLLVMRPRDRQATRDREFALRFLRTPVALTLLNAALNNAQEVVQILATPLAEMVVPRPDQDLADALDGLDAAKDRLQRWQAQADEILTSVFRGDTPSEARRRIIESGRTLRLRVEAASLLDDLGHTVRTRFPYPVAARWRTAEVLQSTAPTREAYGAILDATEILLCYCALVTLALTRQEGIELGSAGELRAKLCTGRAGPGLGEWTAVLTEAATTKRLRSMTPSHPLGDLRGLLANAAVNGARQRLADRRNDQAHMRHTDAADLPDAVRDAAKDLRILLDAAQFLTDWPLVQVAAVRRDSLTRRSYIEYRELMGDHPVVPVSSSEHTDNELEVGSLYLRGPEQRLHLLRPFLIGKDCPVCRNWSTFHVDRAPQGAVVLKSLEHGHTTVDSTLSDVLQIVGLL